jgi:hypothetical protein
MAVAAILADPVAELRCISECSRTRVSLR